MLRGLIAGAIIAVATIPGAQAGTLEEIRARGKLKCGVNMELPGFSFEDDHGQWVGLDVDTCHAVAAAVFGDADKVEFDPLSAKERFTALQSGDVDVLARNTTWTLLRDTALELNFTGTTFYDGQGFMVLKSLGLQAARDLDGAVVCVTLGTTTELNLTSFFRANNLGLRIASFEIQADAAAAYEHGKCDALTGDRSALAAYRSGFNDPSAHVILPDIISKEPLGPVVHEGDDQWFDIVKWTVFALLQAEELGVTSENVDDMRAAPNPVVERLLGVSGDIGYQMGLSADWVYQVIKQVGNYGEIYERNVGLNTPIGLERGVNALWTDGGLMYAMPFR